MARTTKPKWKRLKDQIEDMGRSIKKDLYQMAVWLVEISTDPGFLAEMQDKAAIWLDAQIPTISFPEVKAMLEANPRPEQWEGGNINNMRCKILTATIAAQKRKEEKAKAEKAAKAAKAAKGADSGRNGRGGLRGSLNEVFGIDLPELDGTKKTRNCTTTQEYVEAAKQHQREIACRDARIKALEGQVTALEKEKAFLQSRLDRILGAVGLVA